MNIENWSREELVRELAALTEQHAEKDRDSEAVLHDLRVHQLELELQNRELREAQNALEESRARFEELYDFAPVAYFTFDMHGVIKELNLTGTSMIGSDRAHLIGLPFLSLVKMSDPSVFWAHIRRCVEARAPVVSELRFSTPRLGHVDVQAVSTPVRDAADRVVALRTSFADISERKRIEEDLERTSRNEKRLRQRFEALDKASLVLNRALARVGEASMVDLVQAIVDQARVLADAEFAALGMGSDPDRVFDPWVVSGITTRQTAAIGNPPRPRGVLGAVVRTGRALRLRDLREHRAFAGFPQNHPEMRSFLGMPVPFGGRSIATLYLANKRAGEEFDEDDERVIDLFAERAGVTLEIARLAQELRAAVSARESVLALVSHDLRNPLMAIELSAALVTQEHAGPERRRSRKQVDLIQRSAEEMKRLIDDLLDSAAIEAGQFTLELRPEKVQSIVADAMAMFEPQAAVESVQLHDDVAATLPPVPCDRERITQVLSNLIGNGIKFNQESGNVWVRADAEPDAIHFRVADDGPGIDPAVLPNLFQRYQKGESRGRHGSGLGLYIARGIVRAHGGEIWAESEPGAGSTFHFTIPRSDQPDGTAAAR